MTFIEWCDEIARDTDANVTRELVKEIMITSIRVAIVEFMTNREHADLLLTGIGRFYLNRTHIHSPVVKMKRTDGKEETYRWVIRFKPSRKLKELLNDEKDINDMCLATHFPLFEKRSIDAFNVDGSLRKRKAPTKKKPLEMRKRAREENKKIIKEQIKSKLPED